MYLIGQMRFTRLPSFTIPGILLGLSLPMSSLAQDIDSIPADVLGQILDYAPRTRLPELSLVSKHFARGVKKSRVMKAHQAMFEKWPGYRDFEASFVLIPSGTLPDGTIIQKFSASDHHFTRAEWQEFFSEPPLFVPEDERATWFEECPTCPVTYVSVTNSDGSPGEIPELLFRVNSRLAQLGCQYDIANDSQLHYMIRADQSGENTDSYSTGIHDSNVDDFVFHRGNSEGRPQSVEKIARNAFGLRISGNVWNLSKTPSDVRYPENGQAMRGGSGDSDLDRAQSHIVVRSFAERTNWIGFTLIRDCGFNNDAETSDPTGQEQKNMLAEAPVVFGHYENLIPPAPQEPSFYARIVSVSVEIIATVKVGIMGIFARISSFRLF